MLKKVAFGLFGAMLFVSPVMAKSALFPAAISERRKRIVLPQVAGGRAPT